MFITFEGIDGSGKSTQARNLSGHLKCELGLDVMLTSEPYTGSPAAAGLSEIVRSGDIDSRTETLIFTANRRIHLKKHIYPALSRGEIVICDRYYHSTLAYQGGHDAKLHDAFCDGFQPDFIFYLDCPPEICKNRIEKRADDEVEKNRFEEIRYQQNVYMRYMRLFNDTRLGDTHVIRIDAKKPVQCVWIEILRKFKMTIDGILRHNVCLSESNGKKGGLRL